MNKIFDTHAHYFDKKFDELGGGADSILSSEEFKGIVSGVINVGADPDNSYIAVNQALKYDFMYAAVGIHPSDAQTSCTLSVDEEIDKLRALVRTRELQKKNKIVAIGEIGFDYYWQPVNKPLQFEYFSKQMELAEEVQLPVIIHNREAHGDTFDMMCRYPNVTGVLHSCSMSAEMVREIVKRGWYVSFSGTLTYKTAQRVREACKAVPLDRLLIETDSPYLAPVPHRGKLNNSMLMANTAQMAADIFAISYDEIAEITEANAKRLFGI